MTDIELTLARQIMITQRNRLAELQGQVAKNCDYNYHYRIRMYECKQNLEMIEKLIHDYEVEHHGKSDIQLPN